MPAHITCRAFSWVQLNTLPSACWREDIIISYCRMIWSLCSRGTGNHVLLDALVKITYISSSTSPINGNLFCLKHILIFFVWYQNYFVWYQNYNIMRELQNLYPLTSAYTGNCFFNVLILLICTFILFFCVSYIASKLYLL